MFQRSHEPCGVSMLNRLIWSLMVVIMLFLGSAAWWMLNVPVERFHIRSDLSPAEQAELQKVLQRHPVGGILSTDLKSLRTRLEDMDWAREISVRRLWPATVAIEVLREQPLAKWGAQHYITASGALVALPDEHANLPQFEVALAQPEQAMRLYILFRHLSAEHELEVRSMHQNAQGEWQIEFDRGFAVGLGTVDLAERLGRFLTVYAEVLRPAEQGIDYVDVRYSNGVAVRFTDGEETPDPIMVASSR